MAYVGLDLEYYATCQEQVGEEICRLSRNYGKDSEVRKTLPYLLERRESLENNWKAFEETDKTIQGKFSDHLDHPYFKKGYFESVREIAERMLSDLNRRIQELQGNELEKEDGGAVPTVNHPRQALHTGAIPKGNIEGSKKIEMDILQTRTSKIQPSAAMNQKQRFTLLMDILDKSLEKCSAELAKGRSDAFCRIKIKSIEQNWEEIMDLYKKIDDDKSVQDIQEYFDMQDRVEIALLELSEQVDNPRPTNRPMDMPIAATMKLPKIELPKFDGNYLNWRQFYDLFKQLIHDQPIPPAQKLYFLRANVTGEAHSLIQHFQPTDKNYEVAWKTLVDRFDNRRLLLTAQLSRILSQSSATGTASSLRRMHDVTKEGLQAISNLGFEVCNWDPIVVHLMLQKLDKESRQLFEQSLDDARSSPTLDEFFKFVESRFQTLEAICSREERKKPSVLVAANSDNCINCTMCNSGKHRIYNCSQFLSLSDFEKDKAVRRLQLCRNCLKPGHYSQSCQSRGCQRCNNKHNTLLHFQQKVMVDESPNLQSDEQQHNHKTEEPTKQAGQQQPTTKLRGGKRFKRFNHIKSSACTASGSNIKTRQVYLATAVVNVISCSGTRIPCRALLDSGSQLHFITTAFANELGTKQRCKNMPISGIGGHESETDLVTDITFESRASRFRATIEASIMPHISDYDSNSQIDVSRWKIPSNIVLADPSCFENQRIDMLLGAGIFFELFMPGHFKISNDLPLLRNTKLGWILAGSFSTDTTSAANCHIATVPTLTSLDKLVRKFWETENHELPLNTMTKEEHDCEEHFKRHTRLNSNNQFVVRLPLKEDPSLLLGETFEQAKKRFLALEKKLEKNHELKTLYTQFMHEYEALGHMSPIDESNLHNTHFVIPHHCIMKPDSSSTKLRVVFDASAKSTSGYSLNDSLMVGPTVQPDLFSIITKFRMHRYVFTGDISKMYRQVLVDPNDRMLQIILWRSEHDSQLHIYQLNTVTYGTASASYLATRCLVKLADDNKDEYPQASQVIKNNFYVDDCLTGADTIEEAKNLLRDVCKILSLGNFDLRKFCANHPDILQNIPEEHKEQLVTFHHSEVIKTLGLIWDPSSDSFKFKFDFDEINQLNERVCKRTVLANLARLFDPLGLLGPVIVLGKLFLQELWKTQLSWDDPLPKEQANKWIRYLKGFSLLQDLSIPRYVCRPNSSVELHAFSDSSQNAFGSCVYLRSVDDNGNVHSQLLCSKSRIGPLKTTTIARLELQGAVLMVELVARLLPLLSDQIKKVCYYTDSTTVLAWIKSPSYTWDTYVANRVAKIQANTDIQQWHYVRGNINPADMVSRGVDLQTLLNKAAWFHGPDFLSTDESFWEEIHYVIPEDIPERRKKRSVLAVSTKADNDIQIEHVHHKNSFYLLQKIFAYCFRFYNNCRKHKSFRNGGRLTVDELKHGSRFIWICVQKREFPDDYRSLERGSNVHKGSNIASLSPFFDEKTKLIKVGGRLKNASIMADAKHQILLPNNNCITKLLLRNLHQTHMHAAPRTLIAISRQKYWILSVGRMARDIVYKCIECFRSSPRPIEQIMGNLPKERVTPSRPFYYCGVDFCGPIKTHYNIRGKGPTKSYLAVFVCFSTKAVHIEVVGNLSSEAFIYALKRFIGRRGLCHTIFCDNATNFVGAKNELMDLKKAFESQNNQEAIKSMCLENGINWKYIPPRSPHFGGLWEAAVKSAKGYLIRYLREASLTFEELQTVVIQIEAILNSRPITPMSSDPNDLEALTPGHFLIGVPLTTLPEPDVTDCKFNRLKKFRQLQYIQQHFWKRWSTEYLHLLQQKSKWTHESPNLVPGAMVIIKEANVPPLKWKLGRIEEVIRGNDEFVRVATVKTQNGTFKRAIHNLCPLPIEEEITSDDAQGKQQSSSQSNTNRRKIPRSLLSIFLMVLLIFPSSLAQTVERVNITQLDNAIGIYFEDIGKIQTVNSNWNIYVYYNLTTYLLELNQIKSYLQRMEDLCTQELSQQVYCQPTIDIVRHRLTIIEHNNELLYNFNMGRNVTVRSLRSPFDIVGKVASSLFGVLDQDDARHIENQINNVVKNDQHLKELIQRQTSIADTTANLLKRNALQVAQQFTALNIYLANTSNAIRQKLDLNEVKQNIASLTSYLILIISNFEKIQEILLDVLLDLNHSKINPQIITPHQLAEQIMLIKAHLPATLALAKGSTMDLYKMMSVKGRILEEAVVFEMRLPLADTAELQLFNVLPIPILKESFSYLVETSSQYLAISLTRDEFFPLSELELSLCKILSPQHFLCRKLHPTYTRYAPVSSCEVALLNHKSNALHECKLHKIPNGDYWKALKNSNTWIFSSTSHITGHLVCKDFSESFSVVGNGLLEFKEACMLKMPTMSIKGELEFTNTVKMKNSFVPKTKINAWTTMNNTISNISLPQVNDIDATQFLKLENQITRVMQQSEELPKQINAHDYHHYGLGYILLAGMVGIGITFCYRRRRPIPAPRRSVSRFDIDI